MPSSSALPSLAGKLYKVASPSPLPHLAPYRCFSAKAKIKGKAAAEAASPAPSASASEENKPKRASPASRILYNISSSLSGALKVSETTRPDALKRMWDYIKAHNLQSGTDRSQIVCDPTLKKAFGQDNLKITELMKFMSPHFSRKV